MCSLHLTHPSGAVGSRLCGARGAVGGSVPCSRVSPKSWTLPARARIRTHNLGLPQVSSPTLYPLGHDCPCSLHLTHPKRIRTWSSGQPLYSARGAVRGSVPCSKALQSQFLPARDLNLQTSGYRPDSLTIRPRLPKCILMYI